MELKDLAITALPNSTHEANGFNWETHCMEDIYLRNILPYKNKHIKKLNIVLVGTEEKERMANTGLTVGKFSNLLSIGEVFLEFDFERYYKKDDYGKKLEILDKILAGFIAFANQTNTDPAPFKEGYQKCLDQKLEDEYLYKEAVSGNKAFRVKVFIKVDLTKLEVTGVFFDKQGNRLSEKIFFTRKPEALYHYYLGNVVWSGENEVKLFGRSNDEFWTIQL